MIRIGHSGAVNTVDVTAATSVEPILRYTLEGRDPLETDPLVPPSGLLTFASGDHDIRTRAWKSPYEPSPVTITAFNVSSAAGAPGDTTSGRVVYGSLAKAPSGPVSYLSLTSSRGLIAIAPTSSPVPTANGDGTYFPSNSATIEGPTDMLPLIMGERSPFHAFVVGRGTFGMAVGGTRLSVGALNGSATWPGALPGAGSFPNRVHLADPAILELSYDGSHLVGGSGGVWETRSLPAGTVYGTKGRLILSGSDGWIKQLVIYNRVLTETERRAVLVSLGANMTDTDGDGLPDWRETEIGSNPNLVDTDGDGLTDFEEAALHFTSPVNNDTDQDFLTDLQETTLGIDPNDPVSNGGNDSDGDGAIDREEDIAGTNPRDPSSKPGPETHARVAVTVGDEDLKDDVWAIYANGKLTVTNQGDPTHLATGYADLPLGIAATFSIGRAQGQQQGGTDEYQVIFKEGDEIPRWILVPAKIPPNPSLTGRLNYGSDGSPPVTKHLKWNFTPQPIKLRVSNRDNPTKSW